MSLTKAKGMTVAARGYLLQSPRGPNPSSSAAQPEPRVCAHPDLASFPSLSQLEGNLKADEHRVWRVSDYLLLERAGRFEPLVLPVRRGRRTALTFPDGPPPQKN